jgi:hypothetical protein
VADKGVGIIQQIIKELESVLGTSERYSDILDPARSKSDVFLYYFSQIGMVLGVIMVVIGIFTGNKETGLFAKAKEKILPSWEILQEEEKSSREEKDYSEPEPATLPSIPPEVQELTDRCERGEITTDELENMFIEGKINWKQYSALKSLFIK